MHGPKIDILYLTSVELLPLCKHSKMIHKCIFCATRAYYSCVICLRDTVYKYIVRADYTVNTVCKVHLDTRVRVFHLVDCEILTKRKFKPIYTVVTVANDQ